MSSNQSVRTHWLWFGPSPIAHGVWPFAFSFFVREMSCAHVFGALSLYFLNVCGLYQMTLFEAALAGTPYCFPPTFPKPSQADVYRAFRYDAERPRLLTGFSTFSCASVAR